MITAIDTNVLLDIFGGDEQFGRASQACLRRCRADGALVICEVVLAETAAWFEAYAAFEAAMDRLGIGYDAIRQEAASEAGTAWRQYRGAGGSRGRLIGDFLIGAHARRQAERLLTRDRGFFRNYFSDLAVVDPSKLDE